LEVADRCPRTLYVVIDSPQAHKQWRNSRGLGRVVSTLLFCLLSLGAARVPAVAFDLGEWIPGLTLSPFFSEYSIPNWPLGVQQ